MTRRILPTAEEALTTADRIEMLDRALPECPDVSRLEVARDWLYRRNVPIYGLPTTYVVTRLIEEAHRRSQEATNAS